MLLLISPAKTLDFESPAPPAEFSQPDFLKQSRELMKILRDLAPADLARLMSISDKLAELNWQRFAEWKTPFTHKNAKQALFAFQGDVYTGMEAEQFSADDIVFAQSHLRILSGLYGLLRPLDYIQPYRLEMGTALENAKGKNLYAFWADSITHAINVQLETMNAKQLINLASTEYFGAVKSAAVKAEIITPVFKDAKNGEYKIISFFAKKARGMMSAYIIQNRITQVEDIKSFNVTGYAFNKHLSKKNEWVFTRELQ